MIGVIEVRGPRGPVIGNASIKHLSSSTREKHGRHGPVFEYLDASVQNLLQS